jgi:hypothetical protein
MKRALFICAVTVLSSWQGAAQDERRQAVITGGGGSPKCTIEVEVDAVADVEIRGNTGRLHTLAGSRSIWRRFECNEPMPANPANFRFRGIDGRGRQTLIGDPRNGGAAVVRIEDPKAGREGYTFDLEWGGEASPYSGGNGGGFGYPQPAPQGPPPGGDNRDRGRDGDRPPDRRLTSSDAIHQCGEAAEGQLRRNGYSDTRIVNANVDDQPGHNDWIYGTLSGRRGPYSENFSFACPVDLEAQRIGAVNVRPANDGYYGRDGVRNRGFNREQALRACGDAVQERLRRDGYGDVRISGMDLDNRPGDNDWVVGGLTARRGGYSDNFQFSCSIDFADGRVRSINVDRR